MSKAFVPTCLWTMSVLLASATASGAVGAAGTDAPPYRGKAELVHYEVADLSDAERSAYAVDDGPGHEPAALPMQPFAGTVNLRFATPDDARAYEELVSRAHAVRMPDAHSVARDFIRVHLGVDGDDYVVAHFRTPEDRKRGRPDQRRSLTQAVMEAFPDHSRYTAFALAADTVGGIFGGGASPGVVSLGDDLIHSGSLKNTLAELGRFVWSRTGPGYIYETFFANGNVVETAREDSRSIDEAFGIYRPGGFTAKEETTIRLSALVDKFKVPGAFSELPYVKALHAAMDDYWQSHGTDWTVLARYQFVLRAKWARQSGVLDEAQYRMVMRGGAPHVPLEGAVTMAQLRASGKDPGSNVRRFDINGYTSSDLVRFIAADGSEVMYVPGHDPAFVTAASESALRQWVLLQSKDPHRLEWLLSHFSIRDSQDGVFWTGVKHGLENIGDGRWNADAKAIDHRNARIEGDVFDDMRAVLERRSRSDARMQSSTAGDAWRTTLNRLASLLSPLGFLRPLAIPTQVALGVLQAGTGIEKGIDGRTWEERKSGWEDAGLTIVTNAAFAAGFGGGSEGALKDATGEKGSQPSMKPPQRINGKIGYPLGPIAAPKLPAETSIRLFAKDERGGFGIWGPAQLERASYDRIPSGVLNVETHGIIGAGNRKYVKLEGGRVVRVMPAVKGWRIRTKDGTVGPAVRRLRNGLWVPDFNDYDFLKGSVLADRGGVQYTFSGDVLHRAAGILQQFGTSEEALLANGRAGQLGPLEVLALAHQVLDTLPDRLRLVNNKRWSPWEAELLMPALAKAVQRPIAMYELDGTFRFGVRADGTECGPGDVPATAIRVSPNGGEYVLLDAEDHASATPQPFLNLVATQAGQPFVTQGAARAFRSGLAATLEAGSMRPELEHVHRRWITPLTRDAATLQAVEWLSHIRRALLYRTGLTPDQQTMIRHADAAWRASASAIEPTPDVDAVIARLTQPNSPFLWLDTPYLEKLLMQVASEYDALLPRGLHHLLVQNPVILAHLDQAPDAWSQGGRHYVRLRHLDGRTQVVETAAPMAGDSREILLPGDALLRGSGRRVVDVLGRWFPESALSEGLALMPPLDATAPWVNVATGQPAGAGAVAVRADALLSSMPQPLRRILGAGLPSARVGQRGVVELDVLNPGTGRTLLFRTNRDIAGNPVPHVRWPAALPHDTISEYPRDVQLNVAVPDGLAPGGGAPVDRQGYEGLLHGEQPISAFVEAGYGGRHIKVLVEMRRLRGMLREDDHVAVVGATGEHVFGLVMPVGFDSIALCTAREPLPWTFQGLPAGTIVVDSMFDIRARVEAYPAAVRAKAAEWQAQGVTMKRMGSQGVEVRESPVAFAERMLASPVRVNLWNPAKDPISEVAYVRFVRSLYTKGLTANRAGLDWLETRKARRDYLSYFAPPYDVMPTGAMPSAVDEPAMRMYRLVQIALEAMEQSP